MVPPRPLLLVALLACAIACALAATATAPAASTGVVIAANIPSATTINASACATGAPSVSFGVVLPGTPAVTSADCTVSFASSNDSATLLLSQQDASGNALATIATPTLDTSGFGAGTGKVTAPVGPGNIYARPSVVAADGSIFIATYRNPSVAGDPLTVTKLQANGAGVDGTYGAGGTADLVAGAGVTYARGMAIQPDGKVLVVGASDYGGARGYDWVVARFTAAGLPDPAFGSGGLVSLRLGPSSDFAKSVLVRPNGRIVVSGNVWVASTASYQTTLVQLMPDGSYDPAFGQAGVAQRNLAAIAGGGANDVDPWKIALQSDGSIVHAGPIWRGGVPDVGIGRVDRAGRWDDTFSGDGFREFGPTTNDNLVDVTVDAAGRVLILWTSRAADDDTGIMRFNADGTDDTSWNGNTPVVLDLGGTDVPGAIRTDRAGNVLALSGGTLGTANRQQVTIRRLPSGAPDASFGGVNGYVGYQVGDSLDKPSGILDVDGRIITTGHTRVGARDVIYAVRYQGRQIADWASGSRTWTLGTTSMFAACLRDLTNATPVWTVDANTTCTPVDTDPWRAVPSVPDSSARIASTALSQTGVANMRFGLRVVANEPTGTFQAPISFSVVAPAI